MFVVANLAPIRTVSTAHLTRRLAEVADALGYVNLQRLLGDRRAGAGALLRTAPCACLIMGMSAHKSDLWQ
jgi:hypothetical protein